MTTLPMPGYPKIETLYQRDADFKVTSVLRQPALEWINGWLATEKIDGTNIRLDFRLTDGDGCFIAPQDRPEDYTEANVRMAVNIGGRTAKAQLPGDLLAILRGLAEAASPSAFEILSEFGIVSLTVYGEGYGAGIQKDGALYRPDGDKGFIAFDVLVNDRTWLGEESITETAIRLGLERVPFYHLSGAAAFMPMEGHPFGLAYGDLGEWTDLVSSGTLRSLLNGGQRQAEGIVLRTLEPLFDARGHRLVAKIKVEDFRQGGIYATFGADGQREALRTYDGRLDI